MTRTRLGRPEGGLLVWHHDPDNGALISHSYAPAVPEASELGCFRVLWDDALRTKVRGERERRLSITTGNGALFASSGVDAISLRGRCFIKRLWGHEREFCSRCWSE